MYMIYDIQYKLQTKMVKVIKNSKLNLFTEPYIQ